MFQVFCALIVVMAVSVGYIGNICLIDAPKTSTTPESQVKKMSFIKVISN